MSLAVVVFALLTVAFAASASGLSRLHLSAPIAFVAAGAALSFLLPPLDVTAVLQIKVVAEVALALILFHDAAQIRPRQIRADLGVILRVLVVALGLMVGLGFLGARVLLPDVPVFTALLLAAALAPTDAGLAAPVMSNPRVPARIRRVLNVESGLNDGLVTPAVLFAIAGITGSGAQTGALQTTGELLAGVALGALIGVAGGRALGWSAAHDLSTPRTRALGVLGLPALAFFSAHQVHANGFVAAFVCGTAFIAASSWTEDEHSALELTEAVSEPLGLAVWLMFGLAATPVIISEVGWPELLYAVLSLTVFRMLAVGAALAGSGFRWPTTLFLGWFGPRGLVTVVFVLIALESLEVTDTGRGVIAVAVLTVMLSAVAHGITAEVVPRWYGDWVERAQPLAEVLPADAPRVRSTWLSRHRRGRSR